MANDVYSIIAFMWGREVKLTQAHGYDWAQELARRIRRRTDHEVFVRKADVIRATGVEVIPAAGVEII